MRKVLIAFIFLLVSIAAYPDEWEYGVLTDPFEDTQEAYVKAYPAESAYRSRKLIPLVFSCGPWNDWPTAHVEVENQYFANHADWIVRIDKNPPIRGYHAINGAISKRLKIQIGKKPNGEFDGEYELVEEMMPGKRLLLRITDSFSGDAFGASYIIDDSFRKNIERLFSNNCWQASHNRFRATMKRNQPALEQLGYDISASNRNTTYYVHTLRKFLKDVDSDVPYWKPRVAYRRVMRPAIKSLDR